GHPSRMATAFERDLQPQLDHALDEFLAQQIGREAQDVGVVMATAHLGGDAVMARGGTNPGHLVGSNGHADPRATNEDATLDSALAYGPSHLKGIVGIVNAALSFGADVRNFMAQPAQQRSNSLLGLEASMVAANSNFHGDVQPTAVGITCFARDYKRNNSNRTSRLC